MACFLAVGSILVPAAEAAGATPDGVEFFEKKVRPVLAEHCYRCHSAQAKKPKGSLRLDSRAALLKGGDNGPALVPGRPERSRLIDAVRYTNVDLHMPPRGKLPEQTITDLTAWVRMGAPWPGEGTAAAVAVKDFDLQARKRQHWAWQPVRPQTPTAVRDAAWPCSPVDRFILAKLEEKGLRPAPPVDRLTLLRRLCFDITGLPPTPEQVEAFARDEAPDAYERLVDRLLASPHFGERWGRHWLDLVRYAETRGHEYDFIIPNAYQYRDYVIRAFNADVPHNQFVIEHIAGDLLDRPRLDPTTGANESVLGTGFWFLGEEVHSPVDIRQDEADRFDNRIDVMGKAFLGLTVACARCHDHKFDAISSRDYYGLFAFLESSSYRQVRFDSLEHNRRVAEGLARLRGRCRPPLQRALTGVLRPGLARLADYLLAAREVTLAEPANRAKVEEIAHSRGLSADVLERWLACLHDAAREEDDPLHAWALVAADDQAGDPRHLAEQLRPLVERGRQREAAAAKALRGADVVVDYAHLRPEDYMPDGVGFGLGPVRPGDACFAESTPQPLDHFAERAAAEKDPTWDRLRPAAGAENDPGIVGAVPRAGRTIRTPTFTLSRRKLYYLVRGTGRAYAAVDQHVMISGPLHGQLLLPLDAGNGFRWVEHNLTAYQGQPVYVEFTATPGAPFAVAMIVQAEHMPGPPDAPNAAVLRLLAEAQGGGIDALAAGYARLLTDTAERLANDHVLGTADASDQARLANWLLHHRSLLDTGSPTPARPFAEAARAFAAEQARVVASIRQESRLAPAMLDGSGVEERVFIRGSWKAPGAPAPRRFLEALTGLEPLRPARGSGRLELARQMTDPSLDPFLARVLVNRVWHHLFGRGIVASVDNFGVLGDAPTHPELLDFLADDFVRQGWSLKRLIRELVLSATYRMASRPEPTADAADPQDLLLHRMRLRRLEGEAIRDAMLAVSGRLDRRLFGPPVPVCLTEFQQGRGRPESGPLDGDGRRSVYLAVRRNFLSPLLLAFDAPIPFSTVGRRTVSNVPAQALILMNDPFVHQQAEAWARRVLAGKGTAAERVAGMYRAAFGRTPTPEELRACLAYLGGPATDDPAAWADLAHVLFNVKEFIFLP
jgi:hypothetical protein